MILHGDCLVMLRDIEPDSVDAMVTDPPAGISFMGKEWDGDMGGRANWIGRMRFTFEECLRVLKPGAHALVWAIPRTSHWTATALEDAGFEIRDVVTHLFGTGFPKSLDISKAIDKAAGAEREVVGTRKHSGRNSQGVREAYDHGDYTYSAPSTDLAKQWSGWGTALKPASEHWVLCRKPCSEKTVAANVAKWGVGGLNIDGCRIGHNETLTGGTGRNGKHEGWDRPCFHNGEQKENYRSTAGRFPANLVLSHSPSCTEDACDMFECAVRMLDEQSGITTRKDLRTEGKSEGFGGGVNCYGESVEDFTKAKRPQDFGGGASRFFYCAKASKSDKGETNTHPTVKSTKLMRYLIRMVCPPGGLVLDPFTGSGTTGVAAIQEGMRFVGIEREPEYVAIAQARMKAAEVQG